MSIMCIYIFYYYYYYFNYYFYYHQLYLAMLVFHPGHAQFVSLPLGEVVQMDWCSKL